MLHKWVTPKLSDFKTTFIISQFVWVRNPGTAQLGPLPQGLSQGWNPGVSWGSGLNRRLCWDGYTSQFTWPLVGFSFLLLAECHPRSLDTWSSPTGQAYRKNQSENTSKTEVAIFDNIIMGMTSITFAVFSWLGVSHQAQPTLKGRGLHKGRNTRMQEPSQNLPIIASLHWTSYTSIFLDAFNYLQVALLDVGHNGLDRGDAWPKTGMKGLSPIRCHVLASLNGKLRERQKSFLNQKYSRHWVYNSTQNRHDLCIVGWNGEKGRDAQSKGKRQEWGSISGHEKVAAMRLWEEGEGKSNCRETEAEAQKQVRHPRASPGIRRHGFCFLAWQPALLHWRDTILPKNSGDQGHRLGHLPIIEPMG